jgi:hypothetical protein
VRDAERAVITDPAYLRQFGYPVAGSAANVQVSMQELWKWMLDSLGMFDGKLEAAWGEPLRVIAQHGPLARRIMRKLGGDVSPAKIAQVYGELCECLHDGKVFLCHE